MTGYLKVSVTVLGPKDKLKVHDADEDEKKEKETEKQGRATILMPPAMKRWTDFLVVTLHKMEYLPVMDRGIGKLQEVRRLCSRLGWGQLIESTTNRLDSSILPGRCSKG